MWVCVSHEMSHGIGEKIDIHGTEKKDYGLNSANGIVKGRLSVTKRKKPFT